MAETECQETPDDDATKLRMAQERAVHVDLGSGPAAPLPYDPKEPRWMRPQVQAPQESWDLMEYMLSGVSISCKRYNRFIKFARPISFDRTTCMVWAAEFSTDSPRADAEPWGFVSVDFDTRKPNDIVIKVPSGGDYPRFADDLKAEISNAVKAWQDREPITRRGCSTDKATEELLFASSVGSEASEDRASAGEQPQVKVGVLDRVRQVHKLLKQPGWKRAAAFKRAHTDPRTYDRYCKDATGEEPVEPYSE